MNARVFNFSAGPSMLPSSVMSRAKSEFLNWHDLGTSVMEISHRSREFGDIAESAEHHLREVLSVPSNYHMLFLQGGAQGQFSAIPMNLMGEFSCAAYVHTGLWGGIAIEEARRLCPSVRVIASSADQAFTYIPEVNTWADCHDTAYLHYVDNETVHGVEFSTPPSGFEVPLVVDMSSNLLSRPINVNDYGLIYACAQKNLGPSGITVLILRDDLLARSPYVYIPRIFDYRRQVKNRSMLNTPPTFAWYMLGLVAEWVKSEGGLEEMDRRAKARSEPIYDYIDTSHLFSNTVKKSVRSRMNVVFFLKDEKLSQLFLEESVKQGLIGLKGHPALGGIRASLYNAMPQQGSDQLLEFMMNFEKKHA